MKIILTMIFSSLIVMGILYSMVILLKMQEEKQNENIMTDTEIIDAVIDKFLEVAKIPRPSHHEEKISQFLMDFAINQGLNPVRDN